jgi:DNA invertase Pin-like site-specific DNA recombinase
MKYGYARVSTDDQNPDLQLAALKQAGCDKTFVDEGKSGATLSRPALQRCLKQLEYGDTLTVWKLDRLGRSVRDVVNTLHDLTSRGVQFQSLTEQIDTTHPLGKAMLHMVALLAELERGLIVERTKAGQQAAKRRGVKFGAKPKLSAAQIDHARHLIEQVNKAPGEVATLLNVSRATLWRALQSVKHSQTYDSTCPKLGGAEQPAL